MTNWMTNRRSESDQCDSSVDLIEVIGGRGTPYLCPNISALDRHIVRLYTHIKDTGPLFRELIQELWDDIDLLLDRRRFLELDLQVSDTPDGDR